MSKTSDEKRQFCLLSDKLPTSIFIDGEEWSINPKTTVAIDCLLKLGDDDEDRVKVAYAIKRLIIGRAEGYPIAAHALLPIMEYLAGPPAIDEDEPQAKRRPEPVLDYYQDAPAIVAAFQQAYGLSLDETCNLHWWHFLSLLSNLPDDTRLSQTISIRSRDIPPKASPEEKAALARAKRAVKVKDRRTAEQKKADAPRVVAEAFADL